MKIFKKRFHAMFYLTAMLSKLNPFELKEITQKHNPITTQGFVVQYINLESQPSTSGADFIVSPMEAPCIEDPQQVIQILNTLDIPPDSYSVISDPTILSNICISNKRFPEEQIYGNFSKKSKEYN